MHRQTALIVTALAFLLQEALVGGQAFAQSRERTAVRSNTPKASMGAPRAARSAPRVQSSAPRTQVRSVAPRQDFRRDVGGYQRQGGRSPGFQAPAYNRGRSNPNLGSVLGRGALGRGGYGNGEALEGLRDLARDVYGTNTPLADILRQRDYHDYREEQSKHYRDAMIAQAVVDVVGILATTSQQRRQPYYQPAPGYGPPQGYAQPHAPVPAGQYVRQKVLVQEGRYEPYQVWIPEIFDSQTGVRTGGGFYETRTRYVEPIYEYRETWVPR